jgi:phage-related protein
MKNLSLSSVIEKNKLASDQAWLVALAVDITDPQTGLNVDFMYLVANDEEVTINGQIYQPFPFSISFSETANEIPSISVVIQDQTQITQSYMQNYAGGVGFKIDLMVVSGADKDALDLEPELLEQFIVTDASAQEYAVTWRLGVQNPLKLIAPRRQQRKDVCSFSYRSTSCGYVGALATCDRTLAGTNGCRAHSNATNFGGFPSMQARF